MKAALKRVRGRSLLLILLFTYMMLKLANRSGDTTQDLLNMDYGEGQRNGSVQDGGRQGQMSVSCAVSVLYSELGTSVFFRFFNNEK